MIGFEVPGAQSVTWPWIASSLASTSCSVLETGAAHFLSVLAHHAPTFYAPSHVMRPGSEFHRYWTSRDPWRLFCATGSTIYIYTVSIVRVQNMPLLVFVGVCNLGQPLGLKTPCSLEFLWPPWIPRAYPSTEVNEPGSSSVLFESSCFLEAFLPSSPCALYQSLCALWDEEEAFWTALLKTNLLRGSFLKQFVPSAAVVGVNKVPEKSTFLALHSMLKLWFSLTGWMRKLHFREPSMNRGRRKSNCLGFGQWLAHMCITWNNETWVLCTLPCSTWRSWGEAAVQRLSLNLQV